MARVTVEDCVAVINNRYELVLLGAQRSRDIAAGAEMTVDRDNDKNTVVALREIAGQSINFEQLRRHIAEGVNRLTDLNIEDDVLAAMAQEASQGQAQDGEDSSAALAGSDMFSEVAFDDGSDAAPAPAAEAAAEEAPMAEEAPVDVEAEVVSEDAKVDAA